jgi:hypothetical protein
MRVTRSRPERCRIGRGEQFDPVPDQVRWWTDPAGDGSPTSSRIRAAFPAPMPRTSVSVAASAAPRRTASASSRRKGERPECIADHGRGQLACTVEALTSSPVAGPAHSMTDVPRRVLPIRLARGDNLEMVTAAAAERAAPRPGRRSNRCPGRQRRSTSCDSCGLDRAPRADVVAGPRRMAQLTCVVPAGPQGRLQETRGFQSANVPLGLSRHAHTCSSKNAGSP